MKIILEYALEFIHKNLTHLDQEELYETLGQELNKKDGSNDNAINKM